MNTNSKIPAHLPRPVKVVTKNEPIEDEEKIVVQNAAQKILATKNVKPKSSSRRPERTIYKNSKDILVQISQNTHLTSEQKKLRISNVKSRVTFQESYDETFEIISGVTSYLAESVHTLHAISQENEHHLMHSSRNLKDLNHTLNGILAFEFVPEIFIEKKILPKSSSSKLVTSDSNTKNTEIDNSNRSNNINNININNNNNNSNNNNNHNTQKNSSNTTTTTNASGDVNIDNNSPKGKEENSKNENDHVDLVPLATNESQILKKKEKTPSLPESQEEPSIKEREVPMVSKEEPLESGENQSPKSNKKLPSNRAPVYRPQQKSKRKKAQMQKF